MDLKTLYWEPSEFLVSLSKLAGRPIKDVVGYFSQEFGEVSFKLTGVIFEDGAILDIEGEHDFPYIVDDYKNPILHSEEWEDLYRQQSGEEDDDDAAGR